MALRDGRKKDMRRPPLKRSSRILYIERSLKSPNCYSTFVLAGCLSAACRYMSTLPTFNNPFSSAFFSVRWSLLSSAMNCFALARVCHTASRVTLAFFVYAFWRRML